MTTPSIPSTTRTPSAITSAMPSSFCIRLTADPPFDCLAAVRNDSLSRVTTGPGRSEIPHESERELARRGRPDDAGAGRVAEDDVVVELERALGTVSPDVDD